MKTSRFADFQSIAEFRRFPCSCFMPPRSRGSTFSPSLIFVVAQALGVRAFVREASDAIARVGAENVVVDCCCMLSKSNSVFWGRSAVM